MDGTDGALDDVAPFSALVARFREDHPDTTPFVSSGDDCIPGPRYFAAGADALAANLGVPGEGRADIPLNGLSAPDRADLGAVGIDPRRLGIAIAIFLTQGFLAPRLAGVFRTVVEMLAAIPSRV